MFSSRMLIQQKKNVCLFSIGSVQPRSGVWIGRFKFHSTALLVWLIHWFQFHWPVSVSINKAGWSSMSWVWDHGPFRRLQVRTSVSWWRTGWWWSGRSPSTPAPASAATRRPRPRVATVAMERGRVPPTPACPRRWDDYGGWIGLQMAFPTHPLTSCADGRIMTQVVVAP